MIFAWLAVYLVFGFFAVTAPSAKRRDDLWSNPDLVCWMLFPLKSAAICEGGAVGTLEVIPDKVYLIGLTFIWPMKIVLNVLLFGALMISQAMSSTEVQQRNIRA